MTVKGRVKLYFFYSTNDLVKLTKQQHTYTAWFIKGNRACGILSLMYLNNFKRWLNRSTWMRARVITLESLNSLGVKRLLPFKKGGITSFAPILITRSSILKPRSARTVSFLSKNEQKLLCFTISRSDILPSTRSEMKTAAPVGQTAIAAFNVVWLL